MTKMMKAVCINKPGDIQIVEKPIPVPQKGEALLKIKYSGICGSDIATYLGNQPFATYPRIPGHEFSAEIVEIEENSLGLTKGMIVTANPYFNCGTCYSCRSGKVNCCEQNETMGVHRDGSFAQYITMPIERIYDGKNLNTRTLALIEPFTIGYHASSRGIIKKGEKVLVLGAGAIGIFAMISAKLKGAEVYVVDLIKSRLDSALSLGADGVINLAEEDLFKKIKEMTNGDGMNVVIEAVGRSQSFLNAIETVAFGGKIILIGNGSEETTFNHSVLIKKEVNVYGSRNSLHCFEELIEHVNNRLVDIDPLITNVYEFEDAIKAFNDLVKDPSNKLKVLIKFD